VAFFTPFRDRTENILGTWVYDNKKIAKNYLKGWFTVDVLSLIPYDLILFAVESEESEDGTSSSSAAGSTLRVLRVLRIMKLARILRASRILDRWENHWGVSYAKTSLIKFMMYAIMTAHWLACCWGFAGKVSEIDGTELRTVGGFGRSWIERAGLQDAEAFQLYAVSLYIAFNNVFGSTPEINPANVTEFFVQCFMLVMGSAVWAFIIGSSCGIIATLDPSAVEYRHTMDELNYFMNDKKFTHEHKVRLRSFFSQTLHRIRSERYETLLGRMSLRLRGETSLTVARSTLRRVNYLADPEVEGDFLSKIALVMRLDVFARHERIACSRLTIIERGITSKRGKISMMGSCYGQDMILNNPALRDTAAAIALTFVQVLLLSRPDLDVLIQDYPVAQRVVRKHVVLLAFKRAVVRLATLKRNMEGHSAQSRAAYDNLGGLDSLVRRLLRGEDLSQLKARSLSKVQVHVAEKSPATAPEPAVVQPMNRWTTSFMEPPQQQKHEPRVEGDPSDGVRLRNLERRIDAHQRQVNKRMDDIGDLIIALNRKTDRVDTNLGRIAVLLGDETFGANGAGADIFSDADGGCTNFRNLRKSAADGLREPVKRSLTYSSSTCGSKNDCASAELGVEPSSSRRHRSANGDRVSRLPWRQTGAANGDDDRAADNLLSGRLEA